MAQWKTFGNTRRYVRRPRFSIGKYLKNKNTLIVKLEAIPQMFLGNWPPNANESWKYTVVFNCVYGWHYAQIPSLGIWRSVQLKEQAAVEIESPFIATRSLDGQMRLTLDLHKESSPLKEYYMQKYLLKTLKE